MSSSRSALTLGSVLLPWLDAYRGLEPPNALGSLVTFLHVCEQEGLSMNQLARLSGFRFATASRAIRALAEPGEPGALPPSVGLIAIYQDPEDERSRLLFLTDKGRRLKDHWQGLVADRSSNIPEGMETIP